MACLSYKASPVTYENKIYPRTQLIEAQGYLMLLTFKLLSHIDFNSADQLLLGYNI